MTYNTTPRKPLKGKAREAFLLKHGSACYWCRQPILDGQKWHDEHMIARELGGSDEMENRRPIHADPCHKIKTKLDVKIIAKSNRIRREAGPVELRKKTKHPLKGRGFEKGSKRPWPKRPFPKKRQEP